MSDFRPIIQANMVVLGFRGNNQVVLSKTRDGKKFVAFAVDDPAGDCIPLLRGPAETTPSAAIEGLLGLTAEMVCSTFDPKLQTDVAEIECKLTVDPFLTNGN